MLREAVLAPRIVGEIAGRFVVPGYQRGYRWGREEVTRLLDDVEGRSGRYYLQPIVVKDTQGTWELIDGQQRLTTLFLILRYIQSHLPTAKIGYSIEYATRELSAEYLQEPAEKRR